MALKDHKIQIVQVAHRKFQKFKLAHGTLKKMPKLKFARLGNIILNHNSDCLKNSNSEGVLKFRNSNLHPLKILYVQIYYSTMVCGLHYRVHVCMLRVLVYEARCDRYGELVKKISRVQVSSQTFQ